MERVSEYKKKKKHRLVLLISCCFRWWWWWWKKEDEGVWQDIIEWNGTILQLILILASDFFFIFVDTHSLYFYKNSQFHFLSRVAFATINAIHKFKETQQQQKRKENEEIKYTSGFSMIALPRIAQNRKRARKLGLTNNQCQLACAIKIDIIWVTFTLYILRNSIHKKTLCVSLEECAIWRQWQSTFF